MKKGTAITFTVGVFAGLALCGPAAQAADTLTAKPSSQPIYVNGQRVDMTAYSIAGSNYVKLRDIGKAVNFSVTYDAATNSVHIDPNARYQEEVTSPAQTTPSPLTVTEESVQAALAALREEYPNGTLWPSPYRSTSGGPYSRGINCSGWATLCSDAAFGSLPWRRIDNPRWDQIRPGDLVEYDNELGGHVIVVVDKTGDAVTFTDSSTTQKARWGGKYFHWWLEERSGLTLYTRYPK